MEVSNPTKARNKGAVLSAVIREEQDRFRAHDPHLQESLHEHYDYMIKYLDPVLSPAIEQALLYQPDQIADFLANTVRGTLDPSKYNYVEFRRQQYFDRKVRHLVALAMNSAVKDQPEDIVAYLGDFFEARTKFY